MSTQNLATRAPALAAWLDAHAETLDADATLAAEVLPQLAGAGLPRLGVPVELGGSGGTLHDAIDGIADVAGHSFAAAFVLWGQRVFIEYLLQSPNRALRDRLLPTLLTGQLAGATGLSNVMKYLAALEPLQVRAADAPGANGQRAWRVTGALPWITNLRQQGFVAAAAADREAGGPPLIFALASGAPGITRGDDLDLIALRGSNTASLRMDNAPLGEDALLTDDAPTWLAQLRPAFLGLQCGMVLGLTRRSLAAALEGGAGSRAIIGGDAARLTERMDAIAAALNSGLADGAFIDRPARLFELRIALTDVLHEANALELQAGGGLGYLRGRSSVARRQREAAFVPIVTPSIVQIKHELAAQAKRTRPVAEAATA